MILNTLSKMIRSFETIAHEININILEDFHIQVLNSLERMLALN